VSADALPQPLPPHQREYTITLAYHLREFLIFALDRWTEQGLNRGEACSIRAALLRDEGHEPVFDVLKANIHRLTVDKEQADRDRNAVVTLLRAHVSDATWDGFPERLKDWSNPAWLPRELVGEFHEKFEVPISDTPVVPPEARRQLRVNLINEEAKEFEEASRNGDLIEAADALADLLYVIQGAALEWGIPLDAVFREVHRSNMTKVWADGTVHRRESDQKILKPPTYSPADIAAVLGQVVARTERNQ
jgi:predicted HAD superfamily Cof-like phosphohydrolase